jgi:hypothetical protein
MSKVYGLDVGPTQLVDEAVEQLVEVSTLPADHKQRPI